MATSIQEVSNHLRDAGIRFRTDEAQGVAIFSFTTAKYRDTDGDHSLGIVVRLLEDGEYVTISAPTAYKIPKNRAPLFALACASIQWKTKLIQFEYDSSDGEVRPVIEFPLEDARLTQKQLLRCIHGMVSILDESDYVLQGVIDNGEIRFKDETSSMAGRIGSLLDSLPAEALREALRRKT